MNTERERRHGQRGAVLFMALIYLLVMTLLGVSGMNSSRMENLMAVNHQLQARTLANAELVLAMGEQKVEELVGTLSSIDWGAPGDAWYDRSDISAQHIDVQSPDWDFAYHAVTATSRYVIEYAGTRPVPGDDTPVDAAVTCQAGRCVQVFLVTAQADAGRGARRTVQSVYVTGGVATDSGAPDVADPGPNYRTGRRAWIDLQH